MTNKIENFLKPLLKKSLPEIGPGDQVRVYQKIPSFASASAKASTSAKASADKSADKKAAEDKKEVEKSQAFEGLVIARKHGKEIGATIIVRKVIGGVGVEKIFPLHAPNIEKIELIGKGKVRRAKLYYLRQARGERAKIKRAATRAGAK